jgi:hypothetical protein
MATSSVPYTFVAGTNILSAYVNSNFNTLVTFLNSQVVHRDGTQTFTGPPTYAADPVAADTLTRKSYVDAKANNGTPSQGYLAGTCTRLTSTYASGYLDPDSGTAGPSCTVTVGSSGKLVISGSAEFYATDVTAAFGSVSYELKLGATVISAAARDRSGTAAVYGPSGSLSQAGASFGHTSTPSFDVLHTGLAAGTYTVTMKYSSGILAADATFRYRRIAAVPLL